MACFCIGGPNCCVNRTVTPDWTYRPTTTGPLVTSGSSNIEIIPPDSCWQGHDYFEARDADVIVCRRCGVAKRVTLS